MWEIIIGTEMKVRTKQLIKGELQLKFEVKKYLKKINNM